MKKIIIVESPSKSKTIESYMGEEFKVVASNGHIRDLSTKGKGGLGIDIPAGFIPRYEILKDKTMKVAELKKICKGNEVYLATDPDREGEAISWHLASVLELDLNTVKRIEFNEITKPAILEAFAHPRRIDQSLVQSQETRRMLDRIIGFQLSNLLQKKIKTKSAGRVQSSVLKLIVDLEEEINNFVSTPFYQISASNDNLTLNLVDSKNVIKKITSKEEANNVYSSLKKSFICKEVIKSETLRSSKPAFITSTLQQEASVKYGFSADKTMRIAQALYEGKLVGDMQVGLITYMRTDSTRLSDLFVDQAMKFIKDNYGSNYCGKPKLKNKGSAQDAHEAIRPTSLSRKPEDVDKYLTSDERKIYKLIYNRTISSLMASAKFESTTLLFDNSGHTFKTTGQRLLFDGYLKAYGLGDEDKNKLLPEILEGDVLDGFEIELEELFTKPKPFYTEATIIKTMEELGIGRPSTYAQTISKLKTSKYIEIIEKKIRPTEQGILSIKKLEGFFMQILEPKYTADMEKMLDEIAAGTMNSVVELQKFYNGFYPLYEKAHKEMEALEGVPTGEACPKCGAPLVKRIGKYGEFVSCSKFPECDYKPAKEAPVDPELGIKCPVCLRGHIVQKVNKGKFFYACNNFPRCKTIFPYKPIEGAYCEICGSVMLDSPNGVVCSNRDCKKETTEQVGGVVCPICKEGHLQKRTAVKGKNKGKEFWACDRYPKCKTTFSDEPVNETCGICGSQMVKKGEKVSCTKPTCENFIK